MPGNRDPVAAVFANLDLDLRIGKERDAGRQHFLDIVNSLIGNDQVFAGERKIDRAVLAHGVITRALSRIL